MEESQGHEGKFGRGEGQVGRVTKYPTIPFRVRVFRTELVATHSCFPEKGTKELGPHVRCPGGKGEIG